VLISKLFGHSKFCRLPGSEVGPADPHERLRVCRARDKEVTLAEEDTDLADQRMSTKEKKI